MNEQLQFELRSPAPAIEIRRSARRTVSIEVHPDLRVILRAPLRCPESVIQQFLASRREWIARQLSHFQTRVPSPRLEPVSYTHLTLPTICSV